VTWIFPTFALFSELKISLWLIVDVDFIRGLLHCLVVRDVIDNSEVLAVSAFKVEVCRLANVCLYKALCFEKQTGRGEGALVSCLGH
jgi:hypothetical protein